jgi:hypothetical protein
MYTEKPINFDFMKPPWSGQVVRKWIQVLAWIWMIILVLVAPLACWFALQDGIPKADILSVLGVVALELYMTILCAHVAFRGRAPKGWNPWDRLSKY